MTTLLINIIKQRITISEQETEVLTNSFKLITKKRSEYLVNEGALSSYMYFIIEGYVKCFYNDDGNEVTTQISTTEDFITSFESFSSGDASKENIQCISDCVLLKISKSDYENLYNEVANWSVFCKSVYEYYILKVSDRVHALQNLSASERYLKLIETQPDIVQHISVKDLASYLGIKPQSLSRIRKEIIK